MNQKNDQISAAFIVIGDEILSGRTEEQNVRYLARALGGRGIHLKEVRIIGDVHSQIAETVRSFVERYDYVFTSGGIGPTHDDITMQAIADAFGRRMQEHGPTIEKMKTYFATRGVALTAERRKMATFPEGATLIENDATIAPGIAFENLFALAGVPRIFRSMVEVILPRLKEGQKWHSRTLGVSMQEGDIARILSEIQARAQGISIGSYPNDKAHGPRVHIVIRGPDQTQVKQTTEEITSSLSGQGGSVVEVADGQDAPRTPAGG